MLLSLLSIISCMLTLLKPVLSLPRLGNATNINLVARNDSPNRPKIVDEISGTQREQVVTAIDDAINMVNVVLDVFVNDNDRFMNVYDKYFIRDDNDYSNTLVTSSSSLSYVYLKNINMYSSDFWVTENETNSIVRLNVSPISRLLRADRRYGGQWKSGSTRDHNTQS